MDAKLVSNYLLPLKEKSGLSYETIAQRRQMPESTVKNIVLGKTEDPRLSSVAPITEELDGSLDEMIFGKKKDAAQENVHLIKEMCEHQVRMNETHINNIRAHYEQHRKDSIENYEKRLADKREIIEQKDKHIKSLEKEILSSKIFSWICVAVLVALLIAEVMNPNLGWLRF